MCQMCHRKARSWYTKLVEKQEIMNNLSLSITSNYSFSDSLWVNKVVSLAAYMITTI